MRKPVPVDLVIRNATILTVDEHDSIVRGGAVAVRGGEIVAVGPTGELEGLFEAAETLDAKGGVVHPGFIDAHIHVSQYTARSVLPRMGSGPVSMGDWKGALRAEDEHASATLAACDYLLSGYTGFVDPGTIFEPDAVAAVADEAGIRIWLTDPYVADRGQQLGAHNPELVSPSFLARWPKSTEEAARRVGMQLKRNAVPRSLVHAFVGIYGEATETDELRSHAVKVARAAKVQFQSHLGYNPAGYRAETSSLGVTPLQRFDELHRLGPDVAFTHMNLVDTADEQLLLRSATRIVWCPYGTLQMMGSARSRMVPLADAGLRVAVATDIPRAVNFAALPSMAVGCAAACGSPLTAAALMRMRTRDAAASVGADGSLGSIEAGKRADIVVRRPAAPSVDVVWETAVLSDRGSVSAVIVDGKFSLRDGELVQVSSAIAAEKAVQSAERILRAIGLDSSN